jgi:N-lysine methyltransferase SETD6
VLWNNISLTHDPLKERPDLFPIQEAYTLDKYHMMGSRILSRSFTVQRWRASDDPENDNAAAEEDNDAEDDDEAVAAANVSQSSAGMEVDQDAGMDAIVAEAQGTAAAANEGEDNDDNEEDDEEDPGDVAMVPMADMLNARYGCENVSDSCAPPSFVKDGVTKTVCTHRRNSSTSRPNCA